MQVLQDQPVGVHLYIDDQLYVRELSPLSQAYAERSQVPLQMLSPPNMGKAPPRSWLFVKIRSFCRHYRDPCGGSILLSSSTSLARSRFFWRPPIRR